MAVDFTARAPGVYVEEIPAVGPIQGVGTSTAAFIGAAAKAGPDTPTLVTNWTQYKTSFGEYDGNRMLPYAVRGFFDNGGTQAYIVNLNAPAAGPAPAPAEPPAAGQAAALASALAALRRYDINLIVAPEVTSQADQQTILDHCRNPEQRDRFAILGLPEKATQEAAIAQAGALQEPNSRGFGAIYYPWITVSRPATPGAPANPATIDVTPVGHIAGIYARSDATRGVHKAPANEPVRGAISPTVLLTDVEHGNLNVKCVNALRLFPNSPLMVWGARSLTGNNAYHYVNVERLLIFIQQALLAGLRWAVFEPNDFTLWKKLERTTTDFLTRVWRSGALFGQTAAQAFYIKIDEEVNPEDSRERGLVIMEVGVAPVRPAEFVVIRLALREGSADNQS